MTDRCVRRPHVRISSSVQWDLLAVHAESRCVRHLRSQASVQYQRRETGGQVGKTREGSRVRTRRSRSNNQSAPRNIHIDVSNAVNGPWLKVKDFSYSLSRTLPSNDDGVGTLSLAGLTNDFFFEPLKTRFIRLFITDNHGGDDNDIRRIGFFGVDMRLVNLLREYGLERSLPTLLANVRHRSIYCRLRRSFFFHHQGVNDIDTLDEKRDEILNSSVRHVRRMPSPSSSLPKDKYLDVNDHFQFIRLTESLRSTPTTDASRRHVSSSLAHRLTFLEWFNPPQPTVTAGEKLQTFSASGNEGVTDRVRLEEKRKLWSRQPFASRHLPFPVEHGSQIKTVAMRDLEPIQGRSLVDFPDYIIHERAYQFAATATTFTLKAVCLLF